MAIISTWNKPDTTSKNNRTFFSPVYAFRKYPRNEKKKKESLLTLFISTPRILTHAPTCERALSVHA